MVVENPRVGHGWVEGEALEQHGRECWNRDACSATYSWLMVLLVPNPRGTSSIVQWITAVPAWLYDVVSLTAASSLWEALVGYMVTWSMFRAQSLWGPISLPGYGFQSIFLQNPRNLCWNSIGDCQTPSSDLIPWDLLALSQSSLCSELHLKLSDFWVYWSMS